MLAEGKVGRNPTTANLVLRYRRPYILAAFSFFPLGNYGGQRGERAGEGVAVQFPYAQPVLFTRVKDTEKVDPAPPTSLL